MGHGRPKRPERRFGPIWQRAAAVLVLLGVVAAVLWVAATKRDEISPGSAAAPATVVTEVTERAGLDGSSVQVDEVADAAGTWWDVKVHVPPGFKARRLLLDLQAAAHNQGGRLDPLAVTERGGYGLGALSGTIGGRRIRIVVLGDQPRPRAPARTTAEPAARPRLAVVLDDAGHSLADAETLALLPRDVAVAVLPNSAFCRQVAHALAGQGREVLVHLPMEPLPNGGVGPGEGAISVGLSAEEIRQRVGAARAIVPEAVGVNNHMGSRATADEGTMAAVMSALAGQGLYFLDSRTTAASLALDAARRAGIPALQRDVFLDVVAEEQAVRRALGEAVEVARVNGQAVAIGHVHPTTVAVLLAEREDLLAQVELVPPSRLAR